MLLLLLLLLYNWFRQFWNAVVVVVVVDVFISAFYLGSTACNIRPFIWGSTACNITSHLFLSLFSRSHSHSNSHSRSHALSVSLTYNTPTPTLSCTFLSFSLSLSLPRLLQAVTVGHDVFNFNFWRKGYWNKKGVKHAARDHSSRMWLVPVVTAPVWIFFILVSVYRGKEFFELMPSSVKSIRMKKKRGSKKGVFTWMWLVQVVTAAAWRFQFGSFHRERFFSRSCRLK